MVEDVTLVNIVTSERLELSTEKTPNYILAEDGVDWGNVDSTHHSFKYVNQIGEYVTGTTLDTRDVSITGWVVSRTEREMEMRKRFLNRFVNPQQGIDILYGDYVLHCLPNSSVKYSVNVAENNEVMCKFKIEGYCANPLFEEQLESLTAAASTKMGLHFPLILPSAPGNPPTYNIFGLREPSLIVAVENKGSVSVGFRIVFIANGTLDNPTLFDVNTQRFFKINKTMEAGERIEINTSVGSKYVRGYKNGQEYNYFKFRDLDSDWLQMSVGDNLYRYYADAQQENLEVYIYHNDKYLEVQ